MKLSLSDLIQSATTNKGDGKDPIAEAAEQLRQQGGDVDLAQLEADAVARFRELYNGGEYDPAHAAELTALADVTDAVRTVRDEHTAQQQELDQHVASLASRVEPPADPEPDGTDTDRGDDTSTDDGDGQPGGDGTDASTDAPDTPEGGEPPAEPPADTPPATAPDKQLVTASAARRAPARRAAPTARQINAQRRNTSVQSSKPPARRYTITAAADVPLTPTGADLTMSDLAQATIRRFGAMPIGQRNVGRMRLGIAVINRETDDDHTLTGNEITDTEKINRAADESRLPGGSLANAVQKTITAATSGPGGLFTHNDVWVVPSETDYTLCPPLATREGILDLPSMTITRAGIRYPVWPQFPDQLPVENWRGRNVSYPDAPAAGWNDTNSTELADPNYFREGGAGNPKTCIEGPNPTWVEKRMNLDYLCVAGDILRDRSWPQLTERFISDVLVQHAHYMNSLRLAEIASSSDQVPAYNVAERVATGPVTFANGSLTSGLLDHLLLLVAWFRNRYKMSRQATLEGFAPDWFRDLVKIDLERKSNRPWGSVTNAEIDSILASAGARVQWVYDFQDIGSGTTVDGRVMPPTGWPNTVDMVFYPAGSWVAGEQDIITLDAIYDSTQLRENRYTQLFTEEGWLVLNRCNRSFVITLTNICANGAVGPQRDICTTTTAEPVYLASGPGSDTTTPLYTTEVAAGASTTETQTMQAQTMQATDTDPGDTSGKTTKRRK